MSVGIFIQGGMSLHKTRKFKKEIEVSVSNAALTRSNCYQLW